MIAAGLFLLNLAYSVLDQFPLGFATFGVDTQRVHKRSEHCKDCQNQTGNPIKQKRQRIEPSLERGLSDDDHEQCQSETDAAKDAPACFGCGTHVMRITETSWRRQ